MSKLIEKLKRATQGNAQPMGFRMGPAVSEKRAITVIGVLESGSGNVDKYITGADAAMLKIGGTGESARELGNALSHMPSIPWGAWLNQDYNGEISELAKTGIDFTAFPPEVAAASTSGDDKMGKILHVDESLEDGLLVTVNELPVGAVLLEIKQGKESLSWYHLMVCRHFANVLSKPLLISVPVQTTAADLRSLWDSGAAGVVIDVQGHEGRLEELRKEIDKLTFPPQKRGAKSRAILPFTRPPSAGEQEEEEDEEE